MNKKFLIILPFFISFSLYAEWGPDTRLTFADSSSWTAFNNGRALAVGPLNTIHVVWCDNRDGNWEIYYKRSTDVGISWSSDLRLTNNLNQASQFASICVSGPYVHIIWQRYLNDHYEIYYKRSSDSGVTWSTDIRLTDDWSISTDPSIFVLGAKVHVVWFDERDGNWEVYYKYSTNYGNDWSVDTCLTDKPDDSYYPFIVTSDTIIHVVWQDYRDGNDEIYYKRNPAGSGGVAAKSGKRFLKDFSLHQTKPNPVGSITTIEYSIANTCKVELRLYDVTGRQVATLVNENQKPGYYQVDWDIKDVSKMKLPNSVYFYRLKAASFIESKKMMILR